MKKKEPKEMFSDEDYKEVKNSDEITILLEKKEKLEAELLEIKNRLIYLNTIGFQ